LRKSKLGVGETLCGVKGRARRVAIKRKKRGKSSAPALWGKKEGRIACWPEEERNSPLAERGRASELMGTEEGGNFVICSEKRKKKAATSETEGKSSFVGLQKIDLRGGGKTEGTSGSKALAEEPRPLSIVMALCQRPAHPFFFQLQGEEKGPYDVLQEISSQPTTY